MVGTWFLLSATADAQVSIDQIKFEGLSKTSEDYIRRVLKMESGHNFSQRDLDADLQALKNLYTISDARATVDSTGSDVDIIFRVEEALTLFPIIGIGGIKNNLWFQLGFKNIHLFGRGIEWSAVYGNIDGRHNGNVSFRNPNIGGGKFGLAVNTVRWASTEPLFFDEGAVTFDYDINYLELSGTYEININQYIELGYAYFTEQYEKVSEQTLENPPGPDFLKQHKSLLKLSHSIDRKDYQSFYLDGFSNRFTTQAVVTHGEDHLFNLFINDVTWFSRVGPTGNFGMRLRAGLATNADTPFAPFVIDSRLNIRGSGNRIDRGTGQIILNAEFRQTVFDAGYVAGQVVGFSDLGTWRNPGGDFGRFCK